MGGAGFVGSNLCRRLLEHDPGRLVVVDNLLSSERDNLPVDDRLVFVEGSIADDDVIAALPQDFDYVFHLATFHGNQSSIHDPIADHEHNTLTSLKLFYWASEQQQLQRVVYASAGCTVAEKTADLPEATREDAPVSLYLDSPYQVSKIIGELYGNYFFMRNGLPLVKARFQNVYGPGEILGAGEWRGTPATVWRNVTPTFIYKALRGEPLPVHGDGSATRDFIYVEDIVEGLIRCATRGEAGEVYNLASNVESSIAELARLTNEITGNPARSVVLPAREWDRSIRRYGSADKARHELGFAAQVDLRDGLERTVGWTRDNLNRIEQCMAKHATRMSHL